MKNKLFFVLAFFQMTFFNIFFAQDWPQYLCPDRNSKSDEKRIFTPWP